MMGSTLYYITVQQGCRIRHPNCHIRTGLRTSEFCANMTPNAMQDTLDFTVIDSPMVYMSLTDTDTFLQPPDASDAWSIS